MRRLSLFKLCTLLFLLFTLFYFYSSSNITNGSKLNSTQHKNVNNDLKSSAVKNKTNIDRIVISFVVCDSRFNESLNVIKSVLIFTKTPTHFVIFSDDKLEHKFNETLTKWKAILRDQFDFELQKIKFPKAHEEDWMNLFSKCAAQRLFIPNLITHIDSMMYVDTDTLFLGPADRLWEVFYKMNRTQISAMALEDDNPNISWYPRFAKHPFYGKYGLNSGVMLMNLTRMRDFGWVDYVTPIMLKWKLYIPWGDQDIINIIFHYHENAVYVMTCNYNYRSDQCVYGDACEPASHGVLVVHGSRGVFHNNKQPAFQAVYRAINEYEIGSDRMTVLTNLDKYLNEAPPSNCGNMKDSLLKLPIDTLTNKYVKPDR
ncbi:glucoside xylosyltransferase 1 [Danaus plexippus]|uniref:glucoside xylosyltransferase 1 n=1 Tax=Danaus plexippus TaxID=13037 RepID=UPI002AB11D94|nr:glucoside xylosyltransferase 1 [Danaus plexippus]